MVFISKLIIIDEPDDLYEEYSIQNPFLILAYNHSGESMLLQRSSLAEVLVTLKEHFINLDSN